MSLFIVRPGNAVKRHDSIFIRKWRSQSVNFGRKPVGKNPARLSNGVDVLLDHAQPGILFHRVTTQFSIWRHFPEYVVQPSNRSADVCDLSNKLARENIQVFPRFSYFGRLFHYKCAGFNAVFRLQKHELRVNLPDHRLEYLNRNIKLQILSKLSPQKFSLVFFAIDLNLFHRAFVSKSTASQSKNACGQLLPFAQIKSDHHRNNNSNCCGDAGPFGSLHSSKLPRVAIRVERVAR